MLRLFLFSFVVAATPLLADDNALNLDCRYIVNSGADASERSHRIRIVYEDDEIAIVYGPLPICLKSGTDFEIEGDVIIWSCIDYFANGAQNWTGYIDRFSMRYDVRSIYSHNENDQLTRHSMNTGHCAIVERQF